MSGIPLRTCQRICARIRQGEGIERRPGSRGHSKLNPNDRRRIQQFARHHPKWSSLQIAKAVVQRGGPRVHPSTVWRTLRTAGFLKWMPKVTPMLTEEHKRKRVEWCLQNRDRDWSNIVFTEESYFQFYQNVVLEWGKKRPQKPTPKYGPRLMIWGGISLRGTTILKIARGSVDAAYYQEILGECLLETMSTLYPDGYILQQDNARPHTAKKTQEWFRDHSVQVLPWPPCSPDLNPIENLWGVMKRRLAKLEERSSEAWEDEIKKIWNELSTHSLESFIKSMPQRIEKCIAANGEKIKY
ncbi:hypothetical protein B4U79_15264 [Dinothrombium tinctorium]|uniref:Uncharacterized protein n=2 Tax=Dinothrombium tinctorium TaxID=1965070 RepID=A0A3S3P1D5_9ACAR|nr:hypothetical protein B4U79_15264 [Dinothrombium tinctorium]